MELDKKIRNKTIKDISKFFDKKTSKKIEESIFQFSMNYAMDNETPFLFEQIYNTKSEELIVQFGDSKMLVKKIINKNFKPEEIAFLKVEQLHPEKYDKILKKKNKEEEKKNNKKTTSAYKCPKCGARKAVAEEKQTRRGDEPATIFIECKECGHEWRLG